MKTANKPIRWLLFLACQTVLMSCSFTAGFAQELTPPSSTPGNPPAAGSPQADQADNPNRTALVERLTDEIAALTPGNLKQPDTLRGEVSAAISLMLDNKVADAEGKLDALRKTYPQLPPMQLCTAAVYFAVNNGTEGLRLLEETAIAHPDLPTVYTAFSRLAIAQRRKTDALALLDAARAKIDKGTWSEEEKSHFELAWLDATADLMMLRMDYAEARKFLDQLLVRRPDDARSVMRLAEVEFAQDNEIACLERLRKFSELTPGRPSPELMMATLLAASKRAQQADEWVEKARQAQPEEPKVLLDYASWMLDREKFTESGNALDALEKLSPGKPEVKLLRAKIAFINRDYVSSEKMLGELRVSEPGRPDIANLWAMALAENPQADKRQQAVEVAAQNAQLQPENAIAAAILGWTLFRQNELKQAGEWFGRASQSQRLTPEMAYFMAKFFQAAGQKEQALKLVTQALEQPGLFLYRSTARDLRKELLGEK
ncbi:MAG: HrpB1 family type III secretion system apparatus protein [Planctomycetota bacterium]